MQSNAGKHAIEVKQLRKGTYVVRLESGKHSLTSRIMILR
jgi:hypothetical protein